MSKAPSHLTRLEGVPDSGEIVPGMAHFAGTGPTGKTCGDCVYRGYWRQSRERWDAELQRDAVSTYRYTGCLKFKELTGRHGPTVAKDNRSCKYFQQGEP